ncbi:MAG: MoaD/ThiS family protein [Planctomycetota bacterium]
MNPSAFNSRAVPSPGGHSTSQPVHASGQAMPPPQSEILRITFFAGMAEAVGRRHLDMPWAGGSVEQLRAMLAAQCPVIAPLLARSAVALAGVYAADQTVVPAGADVAIIPPVSGG